MSVSKQRTTIGVQMIIGFGAVAAQDAARAGQHPQAGARRGQRAQHAIHAPAGFAWSAA